MKKRVAHLALVLGLAGAVSALSVACGTEDDAAAPPTGGSGGTAGASGHSGAAGKGGGSSGEAGFDEGVAGWTPGGAGAGESGLAGSAGQDQGGAAGMGGDRGDAGDTGGPGGAGGEAGAAPIYTTAQIERGKMIVRSEAICGSCHTLSGGSELAGNPAFANNLGAPNLTDDATGIGGFTDAQVIYSFRNGIALRKGANDQDRHVSSVMPYWLFHNMSDADALSVVAFLRSLPPVAATVVTTKPDAILVAPLLPSSLPDTTLLSTDSAYAEAQRGKYLVSGVTQCVRCHSPVTAGIPVPDFFSGVPPVPPTTANPNPKFAPNLTPDDTGIKDWTAADVAKALKEGINKAGQVLCGSMPSAAKGYGGMSDADAHAIGVYLTTIPKVSKPAADPALQPACPPPTP